jgi:hypothetical protein
MGETIMATSSDDVYNFIRESGPVLPTTVADKFSMNTLFASAFLSELSSKGKILVSSIKVGGSPLYYLPEQKEKLSEYKDNLHEKEQRTYEMLQSKMVVEDIKLELLDRVALRKMKDYAIALNVTIGFQTRLFWKFFTVNDDLASQIISKILQEEAISQNKLQEETIRKEESKEQGKEESNIIKETVKEQFQEQPIQQSNSTEAINRNQEQFQEQFFNNKTELIAEEEQEMEIELQRHEPMKTQEQKPISQSLHQIPVQQNTQKFHHEPQKRIQQPIPKQKTIIEPYRIEPQDIDYYSLLETDSFGKIVSNYFKKKDIVLIFTELQKKGSDIFGILTVPSAIGDLEYFYYAKRKKTISDKDIKEAYAESIILGYPLLYVYEGKLSKNAIIFSDSKLKGCKIIELNA